MQTITKLLTGALLTLSSISAVAQTADDILASAAERYRAAGAIAADFTLKQGSGGTAGTITVQAEKFRIETPVMSIWYDGETQWTFSADAQEIDITHPTPAELTQLNPFAVINSFRRAYNSKIITSTDNTRVIELTAKSPKAETSKAVVTLEASTLYPKNITLYPNGGQTIFITVNTVRKCQPGSFRLNTNDFPGIEVVDLR